jgi:drug/metabolite transporter (DMT)-like permease
VSTGRSRPRDDATAVHSHAAAVVLLALLALVWGVHWTIVKIGLAYMPPLTYAALRLTLGLATALLILGSQRRIRAPGREDLPIILSVGLLQIAAGIVIQNLALQVVPAGRSAVLVYTMPLWVAVLLALAFRIRPRRNELVGLAFGLGGLALLLTPASVDWSVPGELWGSLALIVNAVLWAIVTIHIRRHHWTRTPLDLQPWQLLVALLPVALVALIVDQGRGIRWEPATVLILLYSGVLATAFATWAAQSITRSLGAQASATGYLAIPVVGLLSGALVLGEQLGPLDVAGFALVLGGVAAASLMAAPPSRRGS